MENQPARVIFFLIISIAILIGWNYLVPPPKKQSSQIQSTKSTQIKNQQILPKTQNIKVQTDMVNVEISPYGGDIRYLELLKQGQSDDPKKPFVLLKNDNDQGIYIAQSGLASENLNLPDHRTTFKAEKFNYSLEDLENDQINVKLSAQNQGIQVDKTISFTKGSYVIQITQEVKNNSNQSIKFQEYYRLLRDNKKSKDSNFVRSFTGPAFYTPEEKFQKISFEDIDEAKTPLSKESSFGWVAMLQHYFVSAWILSDKEGNTICDSSCKIDFRKISSELYEASTILPIKELEPGKSSKSTIKLFSGPGETSLLSPLSEGLDLTKDYGFTTIISKPLFWVLDQINKYIKNWGWSIIVLTFLIKTLLYPLSAKAYRSIAKMREVSPMMQSIREQYKDDTKGMQMAIMDLYRTQNLNPLGGCLPMLIQMPIFLSLYYMLSASVELRQAEWIFWINDLSLPDPYYISPVILSITMFAQTFTNPPPPDPMQARIMRIMPLAFSILFFFFPVGLVIYYIVNNSLSMLQQQWVYYKIRKEPKKAKPKSTLPPSTPKFNHPPSSLKEAFQMAKEQAKQRAKDKRNKKK